MTIAAAATFLSLFASVLAAYAIERLRFRGSRYVGMSIFLAYLVPPSILFIPLAAVVYKLNLFDTRLALILTYLDAISRWRDGLYATLENLDQRAQRQKQRRQQHDPEQNFPIPAAVFAGSGTMHNNRWTPGLTDHHTWIVASRRVAGHRHGVRAVTIIFDRSGQGCAR